ncbi:transporter substrate-binding domain-containing protein [Terasakiella sp. A23]|uniref:substrate-binding periplasmic protein n=1 Tax=Terasakiella sp. FCG-A23 TaxID=3080561 RepID=UPI00295346A3|nr:transporter substrate-binding domain-containing protein [Terasakiella sp. A23]MDV7338397.1 transporter substrate-binding domain-containing protein [Terasakiella sp. A23]
MSKIINIFVIGLFLVGFSSESQAQDNAQSVKVAVPHISQLVKRSDTNGWHGPLIEALNKIESHAGLTFEKRVVPFKRAVAMTKEGAADFGVFMESPKRNQMAMPVLKIGDAVYVVVSLKETPITSLDQLSGKTIARIRGGAGIKSLSAIPDLHYHQFNKHEDGMRLLLGKRVDALVTADFRVLESIETLKLSIDSFAKTVPIEKRELWLYWSWKSKVDFNHIRTIKQTPDVQLDFTSGHGLF